MLTIVFLAGPNAGTVFELNNSFASLGRELDNHLAIDDAKLSRYHVCLSQTPEGYEVTDNQSTNGTYLNGARLHGTQPLRDQDELQFGGSLCRVQLSVDTTATQEPVGGQFVIQGPDGSYETRGDFITIGRGAENHIYIDEPKASREHAQVIFREGAFYLRDYESTNGTYLGERRIVEEPITHLSEARLGDHRLSFKILAPNLLQIEVIPPKLEEKYGIEAANLMEQEHARQAQDLAAASQVTHDHVSAGLALSPRLRLPTLFIDATPLAVLEAAKEEKRRAPAWVATSDVLNDGRRRLYIGGSVAAALVLTMAMLLTGFTRPFMNRPLSKGHQSEKFFGWVKDTNASNDCQACHTSFEGVSADKCKACHALTPAVSGELHQESVAFNGESKAHGNRGECLGCHVEHTGAEEQREPAEGEPSPIEKRCLACHTNQGNPTRGYHEKETLRFTQLSSQDTGQEIKAPRLVPASFKESNSAAWRSEVHATHGEVPGYCNACHSPRELTTNGGQEFKEAPKRACFDCHQSDTQASCVSCHKQHEDSLTGSPTQPRHTADSGLTGGLAGLLMALLLFSPALVIFLRKRQQGQLLPLDPTRKKEKPRDPNAPEPERKKVTVIIKADLCVGCSSCVNSCPYDVLALNEKHISTVVLPEQCVGDMRCTKACPTGACVVIVGDKIPEIEQVDINEHHESNVPGLYVIGEGCGKPLIKNAINHGKVALDHLASQSDARGDDPDVYDVIIVGSGPAGLSAGLSAKEYGLRYLLVEKASDSTDTIRNFPKAKVVLAEPISIPLAGKLWMEDTNKETLIAKWEEIIKKTGLELTLNHEVTGVTKTAEGFIVQTPQRSLKARRVVLAPGTRGAPNKIKCPGEDALHPKESLPRVMYRLTDTTPYKKKHCLVLGGGDSAVEAARSLADAGAIVTLAYRKKAFGRIKDKNLELTLEYVKKKKLTLYLLGSSKELTLDSKGKPIVILQHEAGPAAVKDGELVMSGKGGEDSIPNDYTFALLGAEPPSAFFKACGINIKKVKLL